MSCAPQRYLANNRNVILTAVLDPSSVLPVEDQVLSIPVARRGTADVLLTGEYDGVEEATYDIEIVNTTATTPIVTAPVATGAGSSKLIDIAAVGLPAQDVVVTLINPGAPATYAAVSFEGQSLKARTIGATGNNLRVTVDQTGLTFDDKLAGKSYALVVDLSAGQGGPTTGIDSAGLDFDTAVLGSDDVIPTTAHRIVFGEDTSTIYLQYKKYEQNGWRYHFVPELKRAIPQGTPIRFVTGGRTVTIGDGVGGVTDETYPNIKTVYDLLNAIHTTSQILTVAGVIAFDRSPTGQASRELLVRTDAHIQQSTGTGAAAAGFSSAYANATANTELVVARCFAINGKDHPLARLGAERWEVRTSTGGVIGEAVTNVPFVDSDDGFGFTIPQLLPPGYGTERGQFTIVDINPVGRAVGEPDMPDVCLASPRLGPNAVDQIITLTWTKRPPSDCDCSDMPEPAIGGACLGIDATGVEGTVSYSAEAIVRLKALYDWGNELTSALAKYVTGKQRDGIPELGATGGLTGATQSIELGGTVSLDPAGGYIVPIDNAVHDTTFADDVTEQMVEVLDLYELGIVEIDKVQAIDTGLAQNGWDKWDDALDQWKSHFIGSTVFMDQRLATFTVEHYRVLVRQAVAYAGVSPLGKSDASADDSGDGCWRDYGDPYYFTVEGGENGAYAPLFVNHPYYSVRRATQKDKYFSTHEFGLQLNIRKSCVNRLKEGDEVILQIGNAGWNATYQVGDTITMPVIAASPLYLAGGRDDDSTQTWSVVGSLYGPFAVWMFIPGETNDSYSNAGLSFSIDQGGIPNAKGDTFTFSIEGGNFRWRKNGGPWSALIGIPVAPIALDSGLFIEFVPGAAPSFYSGDLYSFRALQPWAVSNVRTGEPSMWRWADETPGSDLNIDMLTTKTLDTVALGLHTIPSGATLTLSGGSTIAATDWTEPITYRSFLIVQPLSVVRTARYLRLDVVAGDGGGIAWLWAGEALTTQYPAKVQVKRRVRVMRGGAALSQGGAALASARGVTVDYPEASLPEADMVAIAAMFEWTKPPSGEVEPIILVPHIDRPAEAIIGEIEDDELVFDELFGEQPNDGAKRRYSTQFAVGGLWMR